MSDSSRQRIGRARGPARSASVGQLVQWAARRLGRAGLSFGHGTDNPLDEAGALVFHALGIAHEDAPQAYSRPAGESGRRRAMDLVERRIKERVPSAYLTGHTWFAGHEIAVTPAVLVPRSPIAELCVQRFAPWIESGGVKRILDIGTGSGCIAIACAYAFPKATVVAADISPAALEVAGRNVRAHRLGRRVRVAKADVYRGLGPGRYDIIVANPPYVPEAEMRTLPSEYRREPRLGLAAGRDGLTIVRRILGGALRHLTGRGLLVVEVGNSEHRVRRAWPRLPFTWLQFERGGGGVFLITADELSHHRDGLRLPSRQVG